MRFGTVVRAAIGGAVGAMAMTGMRQVTTQLGLVGQVPPEAILKQRMKALVGPMPRPAKHVTIELAHWTYGALGGAAYAGMPASVRRRAAAGPLWGVALWVVWEVGIEPMLGLRQSRRTRPIERATFLLDHLLYGLVVGQSDRPKQGPPELPQDRAMDPAHVGSWVP